MELKQPKLGYRANKKVNCELYKDGMNLKTTYLVDIRTYRTHPKHVRDIFCNCRRSIFSKLLFSLNMFQKLQWVWFKCFGLQNLEALCFGLGIETIGMAFGSFTADATSPRLSLWMEWVPLWTSKYGACALGHSRFETFIMNGLYQLDHRRLIKIRAL